MVFHMVKTNFGCCVFPQCLWCETFLVRSTGSFHPQSLDSLPDSVWQPESRRLPLRPKKLTISTGYVAIPQLYVGIRSSFFGWVDAPMRWYSSNLRCYTHNIYIYAHTQNLANRHGMEWTMPRNLVDMSRMPWQRTPVTCVEAWGQTATSSPFSGHSIAWVTYRTAGVVTWSLWDPKHHPAIIHSFADLILGILSTVYPKPDHSCGLNTIKHHHS